MRGPAEAAAESAAAASRPKVSGGAVRTTRAAVPRSTSDRHGPASDRQAGQAPTTAHADDCASHCASHCRHRGHRRLRVTTTDPARIKSAFQTACTPTCERRPRLPAWRDSCRREEHGDGFLILVSADLPGALFVDHLPGALAAALAKHNRAHPVEERIFLRVADMQARSTTTSTASPRHRSRIQSGSWMPKRCEGRSTGPPPFSRSSLQTGATARSPGTPGRVGTVCIDRSRSPASRRPRWRGSGCSVRPWRDLPWCRVAVVQRCASRPGATAGLKGAVGAAAPNLYWPAPTVERLPRSAGTVREAGLEPAMSAAAVRLRGLAR